MKKRNGIVRGLAPAALAVVMAAAAVGQEPPPSSTPAPAPTRERPDGPPATVGETIRSKVGGAVESIKRGTANAGEAVREQFARARDTINRFGIEQRVYARLHWDKTLNAEAIDLTSPRTGTIVLTGTVADAEARSKAVALTTDTLGVVEVVDRLTVRTNTEGGAPTTRPPARTPPPRR